MIDLNNLPPEINDLLRSRYKDKLGEIQIPPSAFVSMHGQLIEYDLERNTLKTKFPILDGQLNQFGNMQGGMLVAAIDNTFGPLSMLVAPPNITRELEVKFNKAITPSMRFIYVEARVVENDGRKLILSAEVYNPAGQKMAAAKSIHWILQHK